MGFFFIFFFVWSCNISAYSGLKVKEVLAMYRDITFDTAFDNILENDIGYYNFLISGNTEKLERDLTRIGNLFARNLETMTSEVRFTDRIFKFKHNYIDNMFNNTSDTSTSFDTLYFTITGESVLSQESRYIISDILFFSIFYI